MESPACAPITMLTITPPSWSISMAIGSTPTAGTPRHDLLSTRGRSPSYGRNQADPGMLP
jgi:hypothetical protein